MNNINNNNKFLIYRKLSSLIVFIFYFLNNSLITLSLEPNSPDTNVKILACAAVNKKLLETPELHNQFNNVVSKFSKRINHDDSQTKNFVNLLLLNKCSHNIDFNLASDIIKERAETGTINVKYTDLVELNHTWNDYISLTDEHKKELFTELGQIKEILRGLTDTIGNLDNDLTNANKKTGDNFDKIGRNAELNNKNTNKEELNNSLFSNLKTFYYNIIMTILLAVRDNFFILFGIFLISAITVLSNVRIRRKKVTIIKTKTSNSKNENNATKDSNKAN